MKCKAFGELRSSFRGVAAGWVTVGCSAQSSARKTEGRSRAKAREKQRKRKRRIRG